MSTAADGLGGALLTINMRGVVEAVEGPDVRIASAAAARHSSADDGHGYILLHRQHLGWPSQVVKSCRDHGRVAGRRQRPVAVHGAEVVPVVHSAVPSRSQGHAHRLANEAQIVENEHVWATGNTFFEKKTVKT